MTHIFAASTGLDTWRAGLPDPVATPLSGALRYQLFHRTAAAVTEARRFHRPVAAMIVQSFAPDHRWFADYAAFCALFGLPAAPGGGARNAHCHAVRSLSWAGPVAHLLRPFRT
ncbi:MAG: DUF6946 family protein [Rhodobacterales bacterium]